MQKNQISSLRVGSLMTGNNPRQVFNQADMDELQASIKEKGVLQPILVRPVEGGYAIVAGERRSRAAKAAHGEDYQIPVHVVEMTDAEADEAALIENIQRADMSPAEEAEAAAKILGRCENNRDEAAKRLGWSRKKLDDRLALMNCSASVRKALMEQKISLGIAELLAAAPKDKQEAVIVKLLAAPAMPTVAQFKSQLESISKALTTAIFDKTGCAGCQYNSGNQAAMFAEAISDGHCTNSVCFDEKTLAVVQFRKKELEDEYPRVDIVSPGENFTIIKLVAEGATGVGEEQAKACRACKSFGAVVSNVPGKVGNIYRDQCFDSACNTSKVAARLKAEKAAGTQAPAGKAQDAKATAKANAAAAKPTVTVQDSQRVKEYRVKVWRSAMKRVLLSDDRENLSLLIGLMMTRGGSHVAQSKLKSGFEKLTGDNSLNSTDVGLAAGAVSRAAEDVRQKMLSGIVISMMDGIEENNLVQCLKFMQVDLKSHWKVCKEYLELLTKSEIEVVADEIGLKAALGEKYSKAMAGKKDDIIKALLAVEGFDYAVVPKSIQLN